MAVTDRFKMVNGEELYDIQQDPGETKNLADQKPEVLDRLSREYQAFWSEAASERPSYPRVQVGHPEENPTRLTAHWARLSDGPLWQFEEDPPKHRGLGVHGDWISRWVVGASAAWRLELVASGWVQVGLRLRCSGKKAPKLRVRVGASVSPTVEVECSGQWIDQETGQLEVAAGPEDLTVEVVDIDSGVDLDVGEVIVRRN
jgi:hypothetical protein